MPSGLKYKKKFAGIKKSRIPDSPWSLFYRLVALRDIPEHGVKAGDLGGFVEEGDILSHEGSCWIGENAMVGPFVKVQDNAYIGGNAHVLNNFDSRSLVIKENASITGNAKVWLRRFGAERPDESTLIAGNAQISGNAQLINVRFVLGNAKISDRAQLERCGRIIGDATISGKAKLNKGVSISGHSLITDEALLDEGSNVTDSDVIQGGVVYAGEIITGVIIDSHNRKDKDGRRVTALQEDKPLAISVALESEDISDVLFDFNAIKENISAYETDIVKIIKYPVMADRTDPYTRAMSKALNIANRLSRKPESDEFANAVSELEDAFLAAESNALKIASTSLSEEDRKKTETAKSLLAIAANEGSSENEKKVSFKQAFKQLEGVIAVPEEAVDTFRVKIGLKELEM